VNPTGRSGDHQASADGCASLDDLSGASEEVSVMTIPRACVDEMVAHAREAYPAECCGLIGGRDGEARTVYRARNIAADPMVAYEAAPEDLFAAQRRMRERQESLLGIYHSHPHASAPVPSETDVRLAYYPSAIYFIIGFESGEAKLCAFQISEREGRWGRVVYRVLDG
jgi:[CysO sulfur-carrier protein]-S-L-cysteine hydrolase